ncbi:hypothetical protein I302_103437 [Kwoniella bestiolae CBS 10118]|uniref:Myb-like domain-containing protein n=1 Tax=Kwoniella bestiolae CBS 10118 TaxID=1296100 RepID=A0A1B9G8E9_9TREE|nr:hypothetical protein I302_02137 [Kwoniella bestiolae CBS 10118]OCF27296.1 hypothetical protein I302_02137 [Kwoniella bestiolae CBS 10118]
MVKIKRERPSSPVSPNSTLAPCDSIFVDEKPNITNKRSKTSPKKEKAGSGSGSGSGRGSTKVPWSMEEDEALLLIMEDLIKNHLWQSIRSSGNVQLIQRGSYGAQYHAKLLLKQGKLSSHKK